MQTNNSIPRVLGMLPFPMPFPFVAMGVRDRTPTEDSRDKPQELTPQLLNLLLLLDVYVAGCGSLRNDYSFCTP